MPDNYTNTVYRGLKNAYGDKFKLSEEEFTAKVSSDQAYREKVYTGLKSAYGDKFALGIDEFHGRFNGVKKKEQTEPVSTNIAETISQDSGAGTTPQSELTDQQAQQASREVLYKSLPGMSAGIGIWESAMNVFGSQLPAAVDIKAASMYRDSMVEYGRELEELWAKADTDQIEVGGYEYIPTPTGPVKTGKGTRKTTVGDRKRELSEKLDQSIADFQKYLQGAANAYEKGSNEMLVQDIREVKSVDDLINWMGVGIGNAVAQMPLALASGGASSFLLESGLTYLEGIYEKAESEGITIEEVMASGKDEPFIANAMGAVSSALDVVGAGTVAKNILKKVGKEGFKKVLKKAVTSSAAVEGGTETLQSLINQLSVQLQQGKSFGEAAKELDVMAAFNEGLLGAVGGGVLGIGGSVARNAVQTEGATGGATEGAIPKSGQSDQAGVQAGDQAASPTVTDKAVETELTYKQEDLGKPAEEVKPEAQPEVQPEAQPEVKAEPTPSPTAVDPQEGDTMSIPSKYDKSKIFDYVFKDGKWHFIDDHGNLKEAKYENDKLTEQFKAQQKPTTSEEVAQPDVQESAEIAQPDVQEKPSPTTAQQAMDGVDKKLSELEKSNPGEIENLISGDIFGYRATGGSKFYRVAQEMFVESKGLTNDQLFDEKQRPDFLSTQDGRVKFNEEFQRWTQDNKPQVIAKAYRDAVKNGDNKGLVDAVNELFGEKTPPTSPTEQENIEPAQQETIAEEQKESQFYTKLRDNPSISDKIKQGITDKGKYYIPTTQEINEAEAKAIVESKGLDQSLVDFKDNTNGIDPKVRVKLAHEIIKQANNSVKEAQSIEEENRYLDIAIEAEERGREIATETAQTLKMFDDPELNSPRKRRRKIFKNREAITNRELDKIDNYRQDKESLKAEFSDLINKAIDDEFARQQKAIEAAFQKSDVSKKVKDRVSRINTALDGLLADLDGSANASAFFGLDHAVYKGAIQTIKVAINSNPGIKIHEAIQAGIEYIKSKTANFDEEDFRKQLTEKLKPAFETAPKKATSQSVRDVAKKHFFDKNPVASTLKSKFISELGMPEQQAKNLAIGITQSFNKLANTKKNEWVNKYFKSKDNQTSKRVKTAFNKLIDLARSGIMTDEEFDNAILEKLGYPGYNTDQKRAITRLTNELDKLAIERKKLLSELKDSKNPTVDAKKIVSIESDIIARSEELHDITTLPLSFTSMWQSAIQGNLLTGASLINNVYSNAVSQPVRFFESLIALPVDYAGSKVFGGGGKISIPLLRKTLTFGPWERSIFLWDAQIGFADGLLKGTKEGAKQFKSGISEIDLQDYDVKRSMRPWRSLLSAIQKYKSEKRVDFRDATEALIGASPEVMFRALNLGDKPFRRAGETSKLYQEAAKLGYERGSAEWYKFIMDPGETVKDLAEEAGREKTYQKDTFAGTSAQRFINTMRNLPDSFNSSKYAKKTGTKVPDAIASGWKIFWTFTVPYAKTPVNILVDAADLAIPALSGGKALHYMMRGDKDRALKYMGRFVIAMAIAQLVKWLYDDDNINGTSDRKNAKLRNVQYTVDYPNHLNFSAILRKMSGGDSTPQENDVWLGFERWGPLGIALSVQASKLQDGGYGEYMQQEEAWLKRFGHLIGDTMKSSVLMSQMAFEQSFLYGTNQTLEALKGDRSANNYLTSITFAGASPILPNNLFMLSRASRENMVVVKDGNLGQQFINELKQRVFLNQDLPKKIDMWGDPIKQTPEGRNAWVYAVDPTKFKTVDMDSRTYKVFDIFQKVGDFDVIPPIPSNKFNFNGQTFALDKDQYTEFLILVGKKRALLFDAVLSSGNFDKMPDKGKVDMVKAIYADGQAMAKNEFIRSQGLLARKAP